MMARPKPWRRVAGDDHHLCAGAVDRIGRVEMRIGNEVRAVPQQQIAGRLVAAVTQVQQHVFGQRPDAIGLGRLVDNLGDSLDLFWRQPANDVNAGRRAARVQVGSHASTLGDRPPSA